MILKYVLLAVLNARLATIFLVANLAMKDITWKVRAVKIVKILAKNVIKV